ncbi:MAG: aminoacyl-tRNA hydrolase [Candidatus Poribacteria bacterium]|nr:aminoacyl-tRNA hydrolase [Candidatus Poribacteria bacterium]
MSKSVKLIVGLGNPGPRYENTKHNVGFWVVNELMLRLRLNRLENLCRSLIARTEWYDSEIIFAKPMTYMNNSGQAVKALVQWFDIGLDNLCVVYDDLNLELGMLRIRRAGSDGGHNGMKSIIRHLDSQDFPRVRIGIGKAEGEWMDHVLSDFSAIERGKIDVVVRRTADSIETLVTDGVQVAMNRFNGRVKPKSNS